MTTKVWTKYCFFCKHFDVHSFEEEKYSVKCKAFPEKVPYDIQGGKIDHRLPYEGDGGIQFEFQEDTSQLPWLLKNIDVEDARRLLGYSFHYADFNQETD